MKLTLQHVCNCMAAARCYSSGQSIQHIAANAKKSPATIRRWIEETGTIITDKKKDLRT